jgi:hypothetical protein
MNAVHRIAAALAAATVSAHATLVIESFQGTGFGYEYLSWVGQTTVNPAFVQVAGSATEQGGAGSIIGPLNLQPYVSVNANIQVDARLVTGNQADNFNIILQSSASDLVGYQFSASLLDLLNFTTVSLPLTSPSFSSGTIDWTAVNGFQIQGDFNGNEPFAMQFANLQVPEPSTALLIAIGFALLAARRRLTMTARP